MSITLYPVLQYPSFYLGLNTSVSVALRKHLPSTLYKKFLSDNTRVHVRQELTSRRYCKMATTATSNKRQQPLWTPPGGEKDEPKLMLYNSLSRKKEVFIPQNPDNEVTWYNCGPTVYDASHMGHARTYLTFDILRRVIKDYFGYNIFYVMNITDIDDKIIKRARQNYLYEKFVAESRPLEEVLKIATEVLLHFEEVVKNTADPDKRAMQERLFNTLKNSVSNVSEAVNSGKQEVLSTVKSQLLLDGKDLFSDWLDKKHGAEVTDNAIFAKLPKYWEEEFHRDMEALNVLPADCLTRVSEYIPECIAFIKKIIDRGYAYESNGSVYFNVGGFDAAGNHFYAKLVP